MMKDGKGWPSWSQMDDTGKGIFVMQAFCAVLLFSLMVSKWIE